MWLYPIYNGEYAIGAIVDFGGFITFGGAILFPNLDELEEFCIELADYVRERRALESEGEIPEVWNW